MLLFESVQFPKVCFLFLSLYQHLVVVRMIMSKFVPGSLLLLSNKINLLVFLLLDFVFFSSLQLYSYGLTTINDSVTIHINSLNCRYFYLFAIRHPESYTK